MKSTFKCKSGAELTMTIAPFGVGKRLFRAVLLELKSVNIDLEGADLKKLMNGDLKSLAGIDIDLNFIKNALISVFASEPIEQLVHECMISGPCLYNGVKITKVEDTFDSIEARGDYFPCAREVALFNLRPFFPALESLLSTRKQDTNESPESG